MKQRSMNVKVRALISCLFIYIRSAPNFKLAHLNSFENFGKSTYHWSQII